MHRLLAIINCAVVVTPWVNVRRQLDVHILLLGVHFLALLLTILARLRQLFCMFAYAWHGVRARLRFRLRRARGRAGATVINGCE
jgi:hypothetical protein